LAHIPKAVIDLAKEKSEMFESFLIEGGGYGRSRSNEGSSSNANGPDKELAIACELMGLVGGDCSVDAIIPGVRDLWKAWNL